MKLEKAKEIIKSGLKEGFIVHFIKRISPNKTVDDRVPDYGEELFKTSQEAWKFAEKLAKKTTGEYIGFYVTDGQFRKVSSEKIDNVK